MPTKPLLSLIHLRLLLLTGLLALAGCASMPAPTLASQQTQALTTLGFKQDDDGWKLILPDRVLFEFDKDSLKPGLRSSIANVAHQLLSVKIHEVRVEGHTDNIGPREYNRELSLRRANSVAAVLIAEGFSARDVLNKGYGMDRPTANNATEEGRSENRRVEIIVLTSVLAPP